MAREDILTRIHTMPPVDTKFVAGRWHRGRVNYKGFAQEARVILKSLTLPRRGNRRFLIVGRARSGTTLLTRLLNGQSGIHCDGEMFKRIAISPRIYFRGLARKSGAPAYGAKLLSYQMVQVHRMRDPGGFLQKLVDEGVLLIHLERDSFFQTMSLTVAQSRQQYHTDRGAEALREKLRFDPQDFVARMAWNDALLAYERAAFADVDHIHLTYERDLSDPAAQTATVERICSRLGLPAEPVDVPLKKVLPDDPASVLENYEEVCVALEKGGYGHLLPGASQAGRQGT